jgi:spermidine synthase
VLVVGGGDGGAARELVKYSDVEVKVVDLDRRVTEITDELIPAVANGCFQSSRVELVSMNAVDFLATKSEKYDLVIADLTDPQPGTSQLLYDYSFFLQVWCSLQPKGLFVTHLGLPDTSMARFRRTYKEVQKAFKYVGCIPVTIPAFGISPVAIILASSEPLLEYDSNRIASIHVFTKYFDPITVRPPFGLPRHWAEFVTRIPRY